MIEQFDTLTNEERELLYRAPVLLSVLASCSYGEVNKSQKADAIKLAHLKTFTAVRPLRPYYVEVEKTFQHQFEALVNVYAPFDEGNRDLLRKEINRINVVIDKLDKGYARALHKSLEGYAKHVKRAAHSIFQDFIFPISIPGLTD